MIQYQYFHTARGYVSRISLDKDASDYGSVERMFDAMRKGIIGNSFTYAITRNASAFVQATNNDGGTFVKGLLLDDVTNAPAKYIDKLERSVSAEVMNADKLPDASLPELGRRVEDFSLAQNLHHIFAKLIDVLLYGDKDKKIVIIADNRENAANYVKILSMLLPLDFMKNVGFCIGSTAIPDENISYSNDEGYTESVSIKLWLPEIKRFDFDAYASFYYVFDTISGRDNYDRELSSVAKVIEGLNLADQARAQSFAESIAHAFKRDGSVDLAEINKVAMLQLFETERTVKTAKVILNMEPSTDPKYVRMLVNAIRCLLNPNNAQNLTAQDKNIIFHIYRTNEEVASLIEDSLFNYLLGSYLTVSKDEKQELVKIIARDHQNERLQIILDRALRGEFSNLLDAFEVSIDVLKIRCNSTSYQIFENKEIVEKLIRFFDISRIRRRVPIAQHTNGEDFFRIALEQPKEEIKNMAVAILMASAYLPTTLEDCCTIRIRGLKNFIDNSCADLLSRINTIIEIRELVLDIADEIPSLGIANEQRDFIFNSRTGEMWVRKIISQLSIEMAIQADELVRSQTGGARFYESLSNAIREKLLDIDIIRKNVTVGSDIFNKYVEFFNTLSTEIQERSVEIQRYLNELDYAEQVNRSFSNYRCDFAYGCYQTLSEEDKIAVVKNGGKNVMFRDIPGNQQKTKSVENTIRIFGTVANVKQNKSAQLKPVAMWAFGLSVLSSLILILPAIVQVLIHGKLDFTLFIERIAYNLTPAYAFIPLGVFAMNVISFLLLKEGNRIKRANIITLLCAILPLLMLSVGYLIFYFYGLILDIPFLQNFLN